MYPDREMENKIDPSPNNNYQTYVLPSLGVTVQARTVAEAVAKAKKLVKESK